MADEDFDDPFDLPDEASTRAIHRKLDLIIQGQQDIMTALTDLQAAAAAEDNEVQAVLTYLEGVPGLITAAVAAGDTDGPALEALAASIASDTGKLSAAVTAAPQPAPTPTPTPTPPATLTISPDPINLPVTVAESIPLTITGGTGSISAAGLPAGVTFTGSVIVADGTAAAGTTAVTFSDSSTPPVEGTANVIVA